MTLPASGSSISMSQINTELGRSSTATISLDTAENGGYGAINTCASPYPLTSNPASLSEWYGYNHTAACGNAVASYYFDGGIGTTDKLASGQLKNNVVLQANLQNKWAMMLWARAANIVEASQGDPGYQRFHGLWWIQDQDNDYYAEITYDPFYGNNVENYITFTISAGVGTSNFRAWQVPLGDNNYQVTGVQYPETWCDTNPNVNKNANGFVHLQFDYDVNRTPIEDVFRVYWNGNLLTDTAYIIGVNGSGPVGIPYGGQQYAYFGQARMGGLSPNTPGIWYGHLGWITWVNDGDLGNASFNYNGGTPYSTTDTLNIEPAYAIHHFEFATNVNPQASQSLNTGSVNLTNTGATWTSSVYP